MHVYGMAYGVLTTYDFTIFIRQCTPKGQSQTELHVSRPISSKASLRTRKTSMRQCLYYLLDLTQSPDRFKVQNTFALEYWVTRYSDPELWNKHGPSTPELPHLETPQQVVIAMSSAVTRVTSSTDPITVYRSRGGGLGIPMIAFNLSQLKRDNYAIIDGQKIRINIEEDGEFHDSGHDTNISDDENDNAGHGGLEPAYSLTEQLQDLNIQPFGPRMKPPQPSGLMVKFTAESSVSHTGDFGEPDIKSSSSDTSGPIEHAQSGQDGHAFLRRKPEPVSPTPLPRSRIPLPLERSRLAHRAASLSPSRWKPVPDCPTSMPLSRNPVHRGSSIPTPKELPG